MHGGAKGSGAPLKNENALKHGGYAQEALAKRAELRRLIDTTRDLLQRES
jgi:glucans biosynthesis protein